MNVHAVGVNIFHIFKNAAPVLAKFHNVADVFARGVDMRIRHRLLSLCNERRVGVVGGIINIDDFTTRFGNAVNNAWRGGDKVKVIFPLQPLLYNLHMQKP